jgi:hypothetical protein
VEVIPFFNVGKAFTLIFHDKTHLFRFKEIPYPDNFSRVFFVPVFYGILNNFADLLFQ